MSVIHSIYYHNPLPSQLERIIRWYSCYKYRFISIDEFRDLLLNKKEIKEKMCLITLDDGWAGNLELLPVLEKYNVPITIFVATEPVESGNYWWEFISKERGRKGMEKFKAKPYIAFNKELEVSRNKIHLERSSITTDDLIKLSNHPLVSIQSHTVNHPILTNAPNNVLDMELRESQKKLEEVTGNTVYAFSYPNGTLSDREVNAAKKYYDLAFTTEQRHISLEDNPHMLPRVALTGDYYKDLLKIYGIWPYIKKVLIFLRISSE